MEHFKTKYSRKKSLPAAERPAFLDKTAAVSSVPLSSVTLIRDSGGQSRAYCQVTAEYCTNRLGGEGQVLYIEEEVLRGSMLVSQSVSQSVGHISFVRGGLVT